VISLEAATVPLLAVAGRGDGIAPVKACHHLADLVPNAPAVRLETAPGGHLGVLTGRAARGTTWAILGEWLDQPARRKRARRVARARAA
jgi:polyhydroxyalkanoate synthase